MTLHECILDSESIQQLSSLPGERWKCFGGTSMEADLRQPFDMFLSTDRRVLSIKSTVEFYDLMGEEYDTMIAELSVTSDCIDMDKTAREGHLFVHHAGQIVMDVLVVRDTIDEIRDDAPVWTLEKDIGIIVILERGVIAISQDTFHDEMMIATVSDSLDNLVLPTIQRRWRDNLEVNYVDSRKFVSVRDLAGAR